MAVNQNDQIEWKEIFHHLDSSVAYLHNGKEIEKYLMELKYKHLNEHKSFLIQHFLYPVFVYEKYMSKSENEKILSLVLIEEKLIELKKTCSNISANIEQVFYNDNPLHVLNFIAEIRSFMYELSRECAFYSVPFYGNSYWIFFYNWLEKLYQQYSLDKIEKQHKEYLKNKTKPAETIKEKIEEQERMTLMAQQALKDAIFLKEALKDVNIPEHYKDKLGDMVKFIENYKARISNSN